MRHLFQLVGMLCGIVLGLSNNAFAEPVRAPLTPAAAYAALPKIIEPTISADGNIVAYGALNEAGEYEVKIVNLTTGSTFMVPLDQRFQDMSRSLDNANFPTKLGGLRFAPNGNLFISEYKSLTFSHSQSANVRNPVQKLLVNIEAKTSTIFGSEEIPSFYQFRPRYPNYIYYLSGNNGEYRSYSGRYGVMKIQIGERNAQSVQIAMDHSLDWQIDDEGNTNARIDFEPVRKVTQLFFKNGNDWRQILAQENTPTAAFSFVGLNAVGQPLIRRNYTSNFGSIEAINLETGALTEVVKSNDTPIDSTIENPWNGHLVGVNMGGIAPVTRWLEPKLQQIQTTLDARFPNRIVNIVNFSQDMNKSIISISSETMPAAFFVYDATTTRLLSIGATMPTLNNVEMGPVFSMVYKARDGIDIPVYVTVPPNVEDPSNLPTIIFPHGGPEARDLPNFNWWAQFMASRGYLVIQPQFRGSSGFGLEFANAGRRQWGKRMQDDVTDALAWAVREGYANPHRTCIVGASYGGYVAMQAATATPDLFQCVVSFAGISDLGAMINTDGSNYWRDHIGPYDSAAMEFGSPRRHVGAVKAPILLLHGRDDTVVEFNQSEAMADALRSAGKQYNLIEMRFGDHWLSLGPTRLQTLQEIETFLDQHIGASATQH